MSEKVAALVGEWIGRIVAWVLAGTVFIAVLRGDYEFAVQMAIATFTLADGGSDG